MMGIFSCQLAVVVHDPALGSSEVVRGAGPPASFPRQALPAGLLGGQLPCFTRAPLVLSADGARLAEREREVAVRDHRDAGITGPEFVTRLTRIPGSLPAADCSAGDCR